MSGYPERLRFPTGVETGEGLLECIAEVRRILGQTSAERVALLLAESNASASPRRTTLETLIRVAAAQEGTHLDLLARQTVRSRLRLPRTGSLDTHVCRAAGTGSGRYWTSGRGLAALAGLAVAT